MGMTLRGFLNALLDASSAVGSHFALKFFEVAGQCPSSIGALNRVNAFLTDGAQP